MTDRKQPNVIYANKFDLTKSELHKECERNAKHKLKILPEYFNAIMSNKKKFEVRKNDRDFQVGDCIELAEWTAETGFTGRGIFVIITYILDDENYCKEGYVIFSFTPLYCY